MKPSANSIISATNLQLGIIIETGLNKTLRLSGSSVLPAQSVFIVIKTPHVGINGMQLSSKRNFEAYYKIALLTVCSYCAITDSTSIFILLNSSRHAHAPVYDNPENNLPIITQVIYSEQLNTTHCIPRPLARSFVLSVLPVPEGPAGAAPSLMCRAPVIVIQHRSVRGVITSLLVAPMYSQPQLKDAFTYLTTHQSSFSSQ